MREVRARFIFILAVAPLALGFTHNAAAQSPVPGPGHDVARIECADFPGQAYAVFLPANYTTDRAWPIVYCFDPMARGEVPVQRFRAAAETHGYIIVGSLNAQNGPWQAIAAAAEAILADTGQRFRIDPQQRYAAGFSGGARAACAIAAAADFAGVIGCGGGFPSGEIPPRVGFVHFGTAGITDFNYSEMKRIAGQLERQQVPHRLVEFEGGHAWLPAPLAEEALAWLKLQAIHRRIRARDDAFVAEQFTARVNFASGVTGPDRLHSEYRGIIADFDGLTDTSAIAQRMQTLEKSRAFRRSVAATKRSLRREEQWVSQLEAAIQDSIRHATTEIDPFTEDAPRPDPFGQNSNDSRSSLPTSDASTESSDASAFRETDSQSPWPRVRPPFELRRREEPLQRLRRLAADLRRRTVKDPAAERAIAGVFVSCVSQGQTLFQERQFAASAHAFESATILRPNASLPHFEWARCAAAQGDRARAQELLQMATARGFADEARLEAFALQLEPSGTTRMPATIRNDPPAPPSVPPPIARVSLARSLEPPPAHGRVVTTAAPSVAPATRIPAEIRDGALVLDTLEVANRPLTSFGLGLQIFALAPGQPIARLIVRQVGSHSEAAMKGIAPGDEILRVDDRSIHLLEARFDRTGEFSQRFINRRRGDRIVLEIRSASDGTVRTITLTE